MTVANLNQFRRHAISKLADSLILIYAIAAALMLTLLASPAAQAQTYSVIHTFTNSGGDGSYPQAGVTLRGGVLYGTTQEGGNSGCVLGCGTVYQLAHVGSDWIFKPIFLFPGDMSGGNFPEARVVFGPDGHLYGTTANGGDGGGRGVIFDLVPPLSICKTAACFWTENVLHAFRGYPVDGDLPLNGDLIWNQQGDVYGTTYTGGAQAYGTVFQMTKSADSWTETPIYSFLNNGDGANPGNGLVTDANGNLFGTTIAGGQYREGAVFELAYAPQIGWQETVLYSFRDNGLARGTGVYPQAGLTMDSSGNLYGATSGRLISAGPSVFELSPAGDTWKFQVLYEFDPRVAGPYASLTMDAAGNLYGTTLAGGAHLFGNVFKLTNTPNGWVYTSLHDFTYGEDGAYPVSNVTIDTDGTLYGTASAGGLSNNGVVWMIKP